MEGKYTIDLCRDSITPELLVRAVYTENDTQHVVTSIVDIPEFVHFLPAADQKEFWRWANVLSTHIELQFDRLQNKVKE